MIKEYRKTATIKAEQFDGSDEMIEKYGIKAAKSAYIFQCLLPTKEGDMYVSVGDWIATGVDGEHWAIANDIFQRTYEEVPGDE